MYAALSKVSTLQGIDGICNADVSVNFCITGLYN